MVVVVVERGGRLARARARACGRARFPQRGVFGGDGVAGQDAEESRAEARLRRQEALRESLTSDDAMIVSAASEGRETRLPRTRRSRNDICAGTPHLAGG